jgi:Fe-S oxidoreductase
VVLTDDRTGSRAAEDPKLRELILQYLRVRRLIDEELGPRRRLRGEPRPRIGSPLYPQEALRDLALFFYLMALICLLSALVPPELGAAANPDVTPDRLLPDWYLLWAFGLLKIAPNIEVFGVPILSGKFLGVLLTAVTFVAVVLVPWIDRLLAYLGRRYFKYAVTFSEGRRAKRPMADPVMAAVGAGGLVYAAAISMYSFHEVIEDRFRWISDNDLQNMVVFLPIIVGVLTYGLLRAARRTDDYEWKLSQCHNCGNCDRVCPIRPVRDEARLNLVFYKHAEVDDHVWTCLACDRCSASCPQGVVFSDHTLDMRARGVVDEPQRSPQHCRDLLAWHTRRAAERGIPVQPPEGMGKGKVGYFAPCTHLLNLTRTSHDYQDQHRHVLKLMEATGVQVYELEHLCCGHDALWQGDGDTFERLRAANTAVIQASGVDSIVTECAECYRTLAKDYDLESVTVRHLAEFLISQRLRVKSEEVERRTSRSIKVAYHDPCRLGRHMGVYDAPRELIARVPNVRLVELEESRDEAQCCGVAAMMNCDQASKALRVRRLEQVRRTGAEVLVTTCPKCITHLVCLQDEGGGYPFIIQDLSEFLAQRLPLEDARPPPVAKADEPVDEVRMTTGRKTRGKAGKKGGKKAGKKTGKKAGKKAGKKTSRGGGKG